MHPHTYIITRNHEYLLIRSQKLCFYQTKETHWTELKNPASESLSASQAHLHNIFLIPTNSSIVCVLSHTRLLHCSPTPRQQLCV